MRVGNIFYVSVLITCPGRDIGFSCWAVDASRCRKLPVNVEATFMGEAVLDFLFRSNVIYFHDMVNFVVVRSQLWTAMTCYILKNKWKPRKMPSVFYGALKNGHLLHLRAASLADSSPAPLPLPLRVEPKPKSGIRQQDLLKNIIGIKPKRQKVSSPGSLQPEHSTQSFPGRVASPADSEGKLGKNLSPTRPCETQKSSCLVAAVGVHKKQEEQEGKDPSMKSKGAEDAVKSLLGLAYESSDDE
ncbi:uncharacterized protein LOC135583524 isoform X1 [Musa acuminata AAA Group]|uniref:uncharacterized protein LOC135583524 isoform X1 n=1 Tax=Musa acuminata AAA Group TaxID=214697 RepID=UPI0031CE3DCE